MKRWQIETEDGPSDGPSQPESKPRSGAAGGGTTNGGTAGGDTADDTGLLIITGRGRGSGMAAVLGPMVQSMLAEELSPPLVAHNVPGNDGRLRVSGESLERWLRANRADEDAL